MLHFSKTLDYRHLKHKTHTKKRVWHSEPLCTVWGYDAGTFSIAAKYGLGISIKQVAPVVDS